MWRLCFQRRPGKSDASLKGSSRPHPARSRASAFFFFPQFEPCSWYLLYVRVWVGALGSPWQTSSQTLLGLGIHNLRAACRLWGDPRHAGPRGAPGGSYRLHARPSSGATITREYCRSDGISVLKGAGVCKVRGINNERRYLAAFTALIAGEQITSQTASFTSSSLDDLFSLMTLLFNHALHS